MSPLRKQRPGTTPGNQGRFDGYDVMSQRRHWDEQTAKVVIKRLEAPGPLVFFTPSEAETAGALFDLLLGQHESPKIPVLAAVDARLAAGETDGWRYEDMPEDVDAWRLSLAHLSSDALEAYGNRFCQCSPDQQGRLVQAVEDAGDWHGWPAKHVWSLWARYTCSAFYSHPWAWDEIGFGGPAYPRGYKVLRSGWREPWERPEHDAADPVPWASRVEEAKRAHEARSEPR